MSPEEMRAEMMKIPWLQEQKPEHVAALAGISHLRPYKAGDIFFREGDPQDFLYIVLAGRVALDMFVPPRGRIRFYTAEQWDVFGWSSVTPSVRRRTAGAVGVVDGSVVAIDAGKLLDLCDQDHLLGYRVMKRLARIVADRLTVMRLQLLDMFAEPPAEQNLGE